MPTVEAHEVNNKLFDNKDQAKINIVSFDALVVPCSCQTALVYLSTTQIQVPKIQLSHNDPLTGSSAGAYMHT